MKLRKLLAIITAATMLFSSAFAAMGEDNEIMGLEGDFKGGNYTDGFGVYAYDGEAHEVVIKDVSLKFDEEDSGFFGGVLYEMADQGADMTVSAGNVNADIRGKEVYAMGEQLSGEDGASLKSQAGNISLRVESERATANGVNSYYDVSAGNEITAGNISVNAEGGSAVKAIGVESEIRQGDVDIETGSITVKAQGGSEAGIALGVALKTDTDDSAVDLTVNGNVTVNLNTGTDYAEVYGVGAVGLGESSMQVNGKVNVTANVSTGTVIGVYVDNEGNSIASAAVGDVNIKVKGEDFVNAAGVDAEYFCDVTTGSITVSAESATGSGYAFGVFARDGAQVTVNGDVKVSGDEEYGIYVRDGGVVQVDGNVSVSGNGYESAAIIVNERNGELDGVRVTGDVEGAVDITVGTNGYGYTALNDNVPVNTEAFVNVAIEGTLAVEGDEAAIKVHVKGTDGSVEEIAKILPIIIAYEIDADNLVEVEKEDAPIYLSLDDGDDGDDDGDADDELNEIMKSAINYIIRNKQGVEITGASGLYFGFDNTEYQTATTRDTLIVNAGKDATGVKAGKYAKVKKNADGTYTVTVMDGGDLNIVVTFTLPAADCGLYEGEEVEFGAFDFDGDGEAEPIRWKVFRIYNTTVALKLAEGQSEEIADFIETAFTEEELTALYAKDDVPYIQWSRENGGIFANILINVDKVDMLRMK